MLSNGDVPEVPREPALLVILSGPSGAGKDSICDALVEWYPFMHRVVTATTRPMRPGEEPGRDYHFIGDAEFDKILETGGFVEYATVYDRRYGVPRVEIEDPIGFGRDVIARVDVQGAVTLKRLFPDALMIFVSPGSVEEAALRLGERKTDSEAEQQRRLEFAEGEIETSKRFDHIVVNERGHLEDAVLATASLIAAEKRRRGTPG